MFDFNLFDKVMGFVYAGDYAAMKDAFDLCRDLEVEGENTVFGDGLEVIGDDIPEKDNFTMAHDAVKVIRKAVFKKFRFTGDEAAEDLYWRTHLFDAPHFFDSFLIYMERDREPKKRFYLPRRVQLLPCVKAMQDLNDRKIELLAISEPPGIGKTTLAEFYLAWQAGRHPELPNLTGSHNNAFLTGVYGEMLRLLDPEGEYRWHDIFPNLQIVSTNAKDMMIDVADGKKRAKRFTTLEFTSIGSGNAGKVRAMNTLYCDDLVDGIETALSKDRMDKLYQQYYTDLRQRKQGDFVTELHIATRWSIHDVIGRLETMYEGDERAKFIRFAALDKNDRSNFNYPYGLGYTTEQLHQQRAIMDDASWRALYMNEPIEREGQLYAPDELRYYFELPEGNPDSIIAVVDTKDQGSDYCVMPIVFRYGNDCYIEDFICDNGKPNIIEERLAEIICRYGVQMIRFESNRAGGRVAENVNKLVKDRNGIARITTKWNQTSKDTRIIVASGWVKERCLFKDESIYKHHKEYRTAMNFLTGYTMAGKNKHDDVPDAMADLCDFVQNMEGNRATVIKRPF